MVPLFPSAHATNKSNFHSQKGRKKGRDFEANPKIPPKPVCQPVHFANFPCLPYSMGYSYRNDSIGSRLAAFIAG